MARGINRDWMNQLALAGGSGTWWVSERPIMTSQWIDIVDTRTGHSLAVVTAPDSYLVSGEAVIE